MFNSFIRPPQLPHEYAQESRRGFKWAGVLLLSAIPEGIYAVNSFTDTSGDPWAPVKFGAAFVLASVSGVTGIFIGGDANHAGRLAKEGMQSAAHNEPNVALESVPAFQG